jgi:hypothetical protein
MQQELNFYLKFERAALAEQATQAQLKIKEDPTNEAAIENLFGVLTTQFTRMTTPLVADSPSRLRFKLCMVSTIGAIVEHLFSGAMESDGAASKSKSRQLSKVVVTRQTKRYCDVAHSSGILVEALKQADRDHAVAKADFPTISTEQMTMPTDTTTAGQDSNSGTSSSSSSRHTDPNAAAVATGGGEQLLPTDGRNFFYSL